MPIDLTPEFRKMLADARDALVYERSRHSGDIRHEYAVLLSEMDSQLAAARTEVRTLRAKLDELNAAEVAKESEERLDFAKETTIHGMENRDAMA